MASTTSIARSALGNLAVNTFGTPTKSTPLEKKAASRKRRIDDIEEPENVRAARKVMRSPNPKGNIAPGGTADSLAHAAASPMHKASKSKSSNVAMEVDPSPPISIPEEAPSPHSTASSVLDYDPDDTMESQQTTATEVTQPLATYQVLNVTGPSRVSQHAETLRLRLRLAQFKVQTNQTNIPFSRLRLSAISPQSPLDPTQHQSSFSSGAATEVAIAGEEDNDDTNEEKEEEDDENENENETHQPTLPHLPSNARYSVSSRISSIRSPVIPAADPSSSTPSSPQKSSSPTVDRYATPMLPRSAMRRKKEGKDESSAEDNVSVSSSVVRGNAAMGLLGLRG